MKKILLLIQYLFVLIVSYAQSEKESNGKASSNNINHPLDTDEAYFRLLKQHFNFTLLGSQTPSSGFTIETDKPKITLKGAVPVKNCEQLVFNFDLAGGLDNGNLNIFSGQKLNTLFKLSIGANLLLSRNSSYHEPISDVHHIILSHKKQLDRKKLAAQIDTFLVIDLILYDANLESKDYSTFVDSFESKRTDNAFSIKDYQYTVAKNQYPLIVKGILIKLGADSSKLNMQELWEDYITRIKSSNGGTISGMLLKKHIELLDLYGYERNVKHIQNKAYDAEIEQVTKQELYLAHRISWINLSFTSTNANFKLFNSSLNKLSDSTSFLPGITISFNLLSKRFNSARFLYWRPSFTFQRTNNLLELTQFAYKKEEAITVSPGETIKRAEEGTAYSGSLQEANSYNLQNELFWVPWKTQFIPGLYVSAAYRYSDAWVSKNKLPLDVGLTFNVNSKDGTAKNLLTIIPYMGWSNLLKEYKDASKAETKDLPELFVVGVRLGIPINIGK